MRWYANSEILKLTPERSGSRLLVLSETVDAVLRTLLIRPSDDAVHWAADPTALNMMRLVELTWVGELHSSTLPARVPTGHWGLRFDHDASEAVGESRIKQQLNYFNDTVLKQLIQRNSGTLLWLRSSAVRGSERQYSTSWAIAPVEGVLPTVMAQGASVADPLAVEFLFDHPSFDCLTQKLASSHANDRGLAVGSSGISLSALLQELAVTYTPQA